MKITPTSFHFLTDTAQERLLCYVTLLSAAQILTCTCRLLKLFNTTMLRVSTCTNELNFGKKKKEKGKMNSFNLCLPEGP